MESVLAAGTVITETRASLRSMWLRLLRLTVRRPALLIPFGLLAALEFYVFLVVGETPPPFDAVLNPPIRFFYGAPFVSYPWKLAVLPSLFANARVLVEIFAGSLIVGWATSRALHFQIRPGMGLWRCLPEATRRYGALVSLTVAVLAAGRIATKGLALLFSIQLHGQALLPPALGVPALLIATFILLTMAETVAVFAVPALMGERISPFRAVERSIRLVREMPAITLAIVGLPGLPFFLVSMAASALPLFGLRAAPLVVPVFMANIAIAFAARYVTTISAAVLYASERRETLETAFMEGHGA